jgi:hypothetical protein
MSPLDPREAGFQQRLRALGTNDPLCRLCGEKDPGALTGAYPDILCYECRSGPKHSREAHHVAGRANDQITVDLPGNVHRIVSDRQADWPRRTLTNPDQSPLLRAAAWLRGSIDLLRTLIERGLDWIPGFLEWLDQCLVQEFGDNWWKALGWREE